MLCTKMVQSSKLKLRPIEYLCGNIKQKVYENNWSANNLDQLVLVVVLPVIFFNLVEPN
jgi:hypothetical protein